MTDIRAALVEALEPGPRGYLSITADEAIDRILDALADRADEWAEAGSDAPPALLLARLMAADRLIAVLRGDTDG